MGRKKISEIIKTGTVLVSDGAWGTFLQQRGLLPGECPEQWCLERPDDVLAIARSYIDAGANMIETNSFGGSVFKLEHYGLANGVMEINRAAAKISRQAAGDENWVIASVGPSGKMLLMGDITEEQMLSAFKEQIMALEEGGADAVCIETMSAIDEACLAIKAAKENTDLEIICTFTFERNINGDYRTMMGVSPTESVQASLAAGADIVGTNCGNGISRMVEIVREIRKTAPKTPILVHANAGLPENINGVDVFPETPEAMAAMVPQIIEAGANIIGGCCGSTPEHIKKIREIISQEQ